MKILRLATPSLHDPYHYLFPFPPPLSLIGITKGSRYVRREFSFSFFFFKLRLLDSSRRETVEWQQSCEIESLKF